MSRIFIVEDELLIAEDLAQTLRGLGYEVAGMAQTGLAAVMDVEKLEPDLVLMDIKLAGRLDGIQTTAALRKRASVPVVYLTSHSDEATLERAKATGAHGYLLKPFNERELRTAIEIALSKHQRERQLSQREREHSSTLSSVGDALRATERVMNTGAEQVTGFRKEDVTLESRVGVGSAFRVTLPASPGPPPERGPPPGVARAPRRARVLLIDDEELVGRTIERLLVDEHDVARETDPRKALARVVSGERFDVIVCDLSMPHMNGVDVFEQVSALDSALARRIVFLTGGVVSERLEDFLHRSPNLVLNKPFSVDKLLAGIAGQLR